MRSTVPQSSASLDCAFLAQALIPTQHTPGAIAVLEELLSTGVELIASPGLQLEFPSLLRRLVARGILVDEEVGSLFEIFLDLGVQPVQLDRQMLRRAWDISVDLGQSDLFDAAGYVVAEATDGEFVTSDVRFTNAALNRGYTGVRKVP